MPKIKNERMSGMDTINTTGQQRVIIDLPVVVTLHSDREVFEGLGFILNCSGYCGHSIDQVILPDGWSLREVSDDGSLKTIVDEKRRMRGNFVCRYGYGVEESCGEWAHLSLNTRYYISYDRVDDGPVTLSFKDVSGDVVFMAGQFEERTEEGYVENDVKLIARLEEYVDANYPEWCSVLAYW